MLLAAIAIWLVFAMVFWCMMAGAARGDEQIEAAIDRSKIVPTDRRAMLVEPPSEGEPLTHAA